MSDVVDYPLAAPDGVAPAIFKAMILQTMAITYVNAMKGADEPFGLDEGFDAAHATWDTEWDNDPEPRTIGAGIYEVEQDLQYWNED